MGKRGTKPGNKLTVLDKPKIKRPPAIAGMSKEAQKVWRRIVNAYPPDFFKPQHFGMLRAYCETECSYYQVIEGIAKEGVVIAQPNGVIKRHPFCAERDALAATMASLGTKLQITKKATLVSRGQSGNKPEKKSKRKGLNFCLKNWG